MDTAFLDFIPPRAVSPTPHERVDTLVPYTPLPTELLRPVFEMAALKSRHTTRCLLLVSNWVREWVLRVIFGVTVLRTKCYTHDVCAKLPRLNRDFVKQHMTHLAVPVALQRDVLSVLGLMPGLLHLAIRHRFANGTRFPENLRLQSLEMLDDQHSRNASLDQFSPRQPAFQHVTHLRLGYLDGGIAANLLSLEEGTLVSFPALIHLAFAHSDLPAPCDLGLVDRRLRNMDCAQFCLLLFEMRPNLKLACMCVTECRPACADTIRDSKFCVLVTSPTTGDRLRDWRRRALGEQGFWDFAHEELVKSTTPSSLPPAIKQS